jgi:hypothetical protein
MANRSIDADAKGELDPAGHEVDAVHSLLEAPEEVVHPRLEPPANLVLGKGP